ncbi:MAG: Asp-tRNA(Asn)/Glu-tRNA(Gln) amidotransferase subunit GatA [Armatimonadota bacterium]
MKFELDSYTTAWQAADALRNGKLTSVELTEAALSRICNTDQAVKAFLKVTPEQALESARVFDADPAAWGDPLAGIPGAVKDNMCTKGVDTTCGSRILEGWKPPYNATVVDLIAKAGGVLAGKTNLDEFAMGSSTENSAYFTTRNPWDTNRVPGGSSGGSAAAVAAGQVFWALGSDTGGSIRQPAAFCGVVGLKPTYGRVSRYGLVAYASSLDQIGPLTRDVRDCALVMNMISAHDPRDSTSYPEPAPDYTKALKKDVSGFTVGIPREFFGEGIADDVASAIDNSAKVLEKLGAKIVEVFTPNVGYGLPCYYIVAPAEASSNLARYDGVRYGIRVKADDHVEMFRQTRREGFGAEVKQRIMIGTYALSAGYYDAYYLKAQQVRTLLTRDFEKAFETCDVLITPTAPTIAFGVGVNADDPYQMKLSDVCTIPANLAGIPAMSLPCGFSEGLPIGLQIIGPAFGEEKIFQSAYAFEQATDYHTARPSL